MMNTPICDFVRDYIAQNTVRLHMPGHKGQPLLGAEPWDITEINGADVLYSAQGVIRESENNASRLFGSRETVYSAEGSSLCIRAMVYLIGLYARTRGQVPRIAAARNAHRVFMTAAALSDVAVDWLYPSVAGSLLACPLTAADLEAYLSAATDRPTAVYITSPDYLGHVANVEELSAVCRRYGVLLAVDNAHGAYLRFLPRSCHPLSLGADICCDSAHKTLPVLTGGAYLHIAPSAPALFAAQAQRAMALFASTSPSYLILQSLDRANQYLAEGYSHKLELFSAEVDRAKKELRRAGYTLCGNEPLKITVMPKARGYTGNVLAGYLQAHGMVCEFSDSDYTVLMLTPELGAETLADVCRTLISLPPQEAVLDWPPAVSPMPQRLSPREALFAPSETVPVAQCCGRILADASVSCPPAVPIAVCGEEISQEAVRCFEYYGITDCCVVAAP